MDNANELDASTENSRVKKKVKYTSLFWLFMIGSVVGFILEGLWCVLRKGIWENHSATVWGPFCIIYGIGTVAVYYRYIYEKTSFISQFGIGAIAGTAIEYISSLFQELCFNTYSWNYSKHILNIGGRVSLEMSFIWGILGVLFIRGIFPLLDRILNKMISPGWNIACLILTIFMAVNLIVTSLALYRWNERNTGLQPENLIEEIVDKVWTDDKMKEIYSNMKFISD